MYLCVRVYSLPLPAILIFEFAIVPIVWYYMFSIFIKKSLQIPKGGNQKPYIEEEHTTQWPKEKVQKDKQRSTKYTHKTNGIFLYKIAYKFFYYEKNIISNIAWYYFCKHILLTLIINSTLLFTIIYLKIRKTFSTKSILNIKLIQIYI